MFQIVKFLKFIDFPIWKIQQIYNFEISKKFQFAKF